MGGTPAEWREPMLAEPLKPAGLEQVLGTGGWVFERKLDGLRCLAVRNGGGVELWSRNHLPYGPRFPAAAAALARLRPSTFALDGEIVAFVGQRTSFSALHDAPPGARIEFCAFDVVNLLGTDTTALPLAERAKLLYLLRDDAGAGTSFVERLCGDPVELFERACRSGWEGIVAKRESSAYRPGRSGDWRKVKCVARQELVVGGWSEGTGSRIAFGALLVGYYDSHDDLRYAGKVGTGFSETVLRELGTRLRALEAERCAFVDAPRSRGVHWTAPELVIEASFTEWTTDGRLRHPSFLGVRDDKAPGEVRREEDGGS